MKLYIYMYLSNSMCVYLRIVFTYVSVYAIVHAKHVFTVCDFDCEILLSGPSCMDPGRPADGEQIATTYEVNAVVQFTCNRSGFAPYPSASLTCGISGNTVSWNDTTPNCTGKKPQLSNSFVAMLALN